MFFFKFKAFSTLNSSGDSSSSQKMDYAIEVGLRGSAEAVTILAGMVIGETFHRLVNGFFGQSYPRRRKKRRSTDSSKRPTMCKFLWRQFDVQFFVALALLVALYLLLVGSSKVTSFCHLLQLRIRWHINDIGKKEVICSRSQKKTWHHYFCWVYWPPYRYKFPVEALCMYSQKLAAIF